MVMITGRILYHYNACAMTQRTYGILKIANDNFVELHTQDAQRLGIADGEIVGMSSRRGRITARAVVSDKTRPGEVWMPFHYLDGANWLTNNSLDTISSTPEYKVCAVRVEKLPACQSCS